MPDDFYLQFSGAVKNGQLVFEHRKQFDDFIKTLPDDQKVNVVVRPHKKIRSEEQNAYYWGVIIKLLMDHSGMFSSLEAWELHELLGMKFAGRMTEIKGKKVLIKKPTSKMSTGEFEDYCAKIRMWAAEELKVMIPLPNEVDLKFINY